MGWIYLSSEIDDCILYFEDEIMIYSCCVNQTFYDVKRDVMFESI